MKGVCNLCNNNKLSSIRKDFLARKYYVQPNTQFCDLLSNNQENKTM